MSTTLSTSSPPVVPYTVIGGAQKSRFHKYLFGVSIIVLNRGGRIFREETLAELGQSESFEVIVIEGPQPIPEIDTFARKYPGVRFLLLHEECTTGEKVNLGIEEAQSRLVCVISSDMRIPQPALSTRLLEKIDTRTILCTLPVIKNRRMETIPSLMVPGYVGKKMKIAPWHPLHDGMRGIFPFDYSGIYNKERFKFSGGYDPAIRSTYWQKADFGFRNALWGEEMAVNAAFFFQYRGEVPLEDATPDEGYKAFYLKNIAVDFRKDRGVLGFRKFLVYLFKSGSPFPKALREFRAAQAWVRKNRYRFKTDADELVASWRVPE